MPNRSAAVVKLNWIDVVAEEFNKKQKAAQDASEELSRLRAKIIERVQKDGHVPARATKTKALSGEKYELRVSLPVEVTVDTRAAIAIKDACLRSGAGRLWMRLFRTVKTFVLVEGTDKVMNGTLPKNAPRNLRSLFARAVRVREMAPQLEVRELKEKEAA